MSLKDEILARVQQAKDRRLELPVHDDAGNLVSTMRMIAADPLHTRLVADWREANKDWYPTVFAYNLDNTRKWIEKQVLANPERILFFLFTPDGEPWGHLGLATFSFDPHAACEIDAVMRGRSDLAPGAMTPAVRSLVRWAFDEVGIGRMGLRVFSDNERAVRLYERVGFEPGRLIPLVYEEGDPISSWREAKPGEEPGRHFLEMRLPEGYPGR